jgi:hypothetical protein
MYIVYEEAACVLLALITSTLLCLTYVMYVLLSGGARILTPYAEKAYTGRHSVEREMNSRRVTPDLVTAIADPLPLACTVPSECT